MKFKEKPKFHEVLYDDLKKSIERLNYSRKIFSTEYYSSYHDSLMTDVLIQQNFEIIKLLSEINIKLDK